MISKGFDKEANDLGLTPAELEDGLINAGMFNKSGTPKKKYVDDHTFTPEGDIRSPKQFEATYNDKLDEQINNM